jgi:hypothetical protein
MLISLQSRFLPPTILSVVLYPISCTSLWMPSFFTLTIHSFRVAFFEQRLREIWRFNSSGTRRRVHSLLSPSSYCMQPKKTCTVIIETEGILWNVDNYLPIYTVSCPRKLSSLINATLLTSDKGNSPANTSCFVYHSKYLISEDFAPVLYFKSKYWSLIIPLHFHSAFIQLLSTLYSLYTVVFSK